MTKRRPPRHVCRCPPRCETALTEVALSLHNASRGEDRRKHCGGGDCATTHSWIAAEPVDAYCLVSTCPDFRINVYQMCRLGKLSYVAGAEIPKRYLGTS